MKKNTNLRLYGVFGYPLSHSLSPIMHEAAFRAAGVNASYVALEHDGAGFKKILRSLKTGPLSGFNITVPYKETVMSYLDGVSSQAKAMKAVNTVYRRNGKWLGENTDITGFLLSLKKDGKFTAKGKTALVLGAGGASRAVIYGLAREGAVEILIANRTRARGQKIIRDLKRLFPKVRMSVVNFEEVDLCKAIGKADLVVNTTSLGLKTTDPSIVPKKWIPKAVKKKLFVDLIYHRKQTKFLQVAKQKGHRVMNGVGMLVYQGARAWEIWTGKKAPVQVMRSTLEKALAA